MSIQLYTAFVERTSDGYSVHFPDLPIGGAGATIEAAYESAAEAGQLYAAEVARDGETMPTPTPANEARPEAGAEVVMSFLVPINGPGKAVRLNITMDEGLVAAIDQVANNRSAFLADAARDRLSRLPS